MERDILHLSFPSFSLQVLVGSLNKFLDRPAALARSDSLSGRVLSINPRARSEGIRRGMALAEAQRRCSKLDVLMPKPGLFIKANRDVGAFLSGWSPLVEQAGGGFYIDLTGTRRLFGPAANVTGKLVREFGDRFGLVSSAGIGSCKLVGRAASSVVDAPGLAQVMPTGEAAFLRPFPLKRFVGKDRKLLSRLRELGLERVCDLQDFSLPELMSAFGQNGRRLYNLARGIDFSPVTPADSAPAIEEGEILSEATNDIDLVRLALLRLSSTLGRRLRERKMSAGFLRLLVVYKDGRRAERKALLRMLTAYDREIYEKSLALARSALTRRVQLIYIGLRASQLTSGYQPDLFGKVEKQDRLYKSIDEIRKKYGEGAIRSGTEARPAGSASS